MLLLLVIITSIQIHSISCQMKCSYGERGSLMSTCVGANAGYFKSTPYRFDNLDETLRCINCSLNVIPSNTFDISGNQIQTLDLSNSKISTLQTRAFVGLIFMKNLLMQNNQIRTISAGTFQGIRKLENLNLENNTINSLTDSGFKELINLVTLNLKGNFIKYIDRKAFDDLSALTELNLANNQIMDVKNIFQDLTSILKINLENNRISNINPLDLDKNLDTLLELNLRKNYLKTLSDDVFLSLRDLEILNLSFNPIRTIAPGSFRGLHALETLTLEHNALIELTKGIFEGLHHLRDLQLAYNMLSTFASGTFSGLPELRALNLSHNRVATIKKTGIYPLLSLHTLDISYNNVSDFDFLLFAPVLPRISYLKLEGNKWPCYLVIDIKHFFKDDNIKISIDEEENTCNNTESQRNDQIYNNLTEPGPQSVNLYESKSGESSSEDSVFLYLLVCSLSMGVILLSYHQYRISRRIKEILGKSNCAEVNLLSSSDLEGRSHEYFND